MTEFEKVMVGIGVFMGPVFTLINLIIYGYMLKLYTEIFKARDVRPK